jgi:hypothetical protein
MGNSACMGIVRRALPALLCLVGSAAPLYGQMPNSRPAKPPTIEPLKLVPDAQVPGVNTIKIERVITAADSKVGDRYAQSFQIRLNINELVDIQMKSDDFDAYLDIRRDNDVAQPIAFNDDGGEVFNARLQMTAPTTDNYVIRAQAADGIGKYTLIVSTQKPAEAPTVATLVVGQPQRATFGGDAARDDGKPYAVYTFHGAAGTRIAIDMKSKNFDPQVSLALLGPSGIAPVSTDDDGGEGQDARLLAVLPRTGDYQVTATSGDGGLGRYTLEMKQKEAEVGAPRKLAPGDSLTERLDFDSPGTQIGRAGQGGYLYRPYLLEVEPGREVSIEMRSDGFRPMLVAGTPSPIGFAAAASSADTRRDLLNRRAALTLKPDDKGTIYILARGEARSPQGSYSITVRNAPPAPQR